jgi:DNA polymerase
MFTIPLPQIGTDVAWRDAAKRLMGAGIPPDEILWDYAGKIAPLLEGATDLPAPKRRVQAPQSFLKLVQSVIWHKDDDRFTRLYALLWRLRLAPSLMNDGTDADVIALRKLEDDVLRAQSRMHKSVSFRDLRQGGARQSFAAWYAPPHHIVEPCAPYFAQRLPHLDWMITTPGVTAQFVDGNLSFHPGQPKPDWPLSRTRMDQYLGDLFNPTGEVQPPPI